MDGVSGVLFLFIVVMGIVPAFIMMRNAEEKILDNKNEIEAQRLLLEKLEDKINNLAEHIVDLQGSLVDYRDELKKIKKKIKSEGSEQ